MDIKKLFGKNVKEHRLKMKLTQEELAEKIGISPKSLSQIELGNNFISAENLDAICGALAVRAKTLFDFGEDENPDKYEFINKKLKNNTDLTAKIYNIINLFE